MGIVTVTKLENADKDADSLNTFINGSDTAKVKTRTNKEYPTLANAVRQVMETGGFEPFSTETALLASRPTITKKAAKALDTKKVWLWDGSKWNDTGLSELELAKDFANANALFKPVPLTIDSDLNTYTVNGTYPAGTASIASLDRNFPITVGGVLDVFRRSVSIVQQTYTTPLNIYIRVLSGGNWTAWEKQINNTEFNTVINDINVGALTKNDLLLSGNLYDGSNNTADKYVHLATASIMASTGAVLAQVPVKVGVTYHVQANNLASNIFTVALRADASTENGVTLGVVTLETITATHKTFKIPEDSTAKYALFTVTLPSLSFDISNSINIYADVGEKTDIKVRKINGYSIEAAETSSVLKDKKWIAIGDSITEKNSRTNLNYHDFISADVGGMTVYNKGISGSGFHDRMNVTETLTEQADYITIFWGTNDFGLVRNTYPLGTFLSNDTETISGRINICLSTLITKYPLAKIAIISALPRLTNYGSNATPNSVGYTLKQHVDLLKQYAAHYSLPFLNLYEQSNLPVWVPAANQYYFTAPGQTSPDGLHPNDAGHRVMADKIKAFLESI